MSSGFNLSSRKKRSGLLYITKPEPEPTLDSIDADLDLLKSKSDNFFDNLSGEVKESFRKVVDNIKSIKDDSEKYSKFHEKLVERFGDSKDITPGTIGAYFGGCLVQHNGDYPRGCSALCAGSAPLPGIDNSVCSYPVFLSKKRGSRNLTFTHINGVKDMTKIILYTDKEDYEGLSEEEKNAFKERGVNEMLILDEKSGDKINDWTDISSIKERNMLGDSENKYRYMNYIIIGVLVAIIIIAVIIYKKNSEKKGKLKPRKKKAEPVD